MTLTVLEPEGLYADTGIEQEILGPGVRILQGNARASLAELPDALLAEVDGLMTLRMAVPAEQIARFSKLKVVVRMGVGYDRVDRAACAARGILVANLPDYGTQEVAEFAVLLALSLRRGLLLYHDVGLVVGKTVRQAVIRILGCGLTGHTRQSGCGAVRVMLR